MNRRIRRAGTLLAATTLLSLLPAGAGAQEAAPEPAPTEASAPEFSVQPSGPNGPGGRDYFVYDLAPGETFGDTVAVSNLGDAAGALRHLRHRRLQRRGHRRLHPPQGGGASRPTSARGCCSASPTTRSHRASGPTSPSASPCRPTSSPATTPVRSSPSRCSRRGPGRRDLVLRRPPPHRRPHVRPRSTVRPSRRCVSIASTSTTSRASAPPPARPR